MHIRFLFLFASLLVLISCNTNNSASQQNSHPTTIYGSAANGNVKQTLISLYPIINGSASSVAATTISDQQGRYTLTVNTQYNGPWLLSMSAAASPYSSVMQCDIAIGCDADGDGINEVGFAKTMPVEADFHLSTIIPNLIINGENRVNISILTHMASALAMNQFSSLTAANISHANSQVANLFKINHTLPQLTSVSLSHSLSSTNRSHGAIRAALFNAAIFAAINLKGGDLLQRNISAFSEQFGQNGGQLPLTSSDITTISLHHILQQAHHIILQLENPTADSIQNQSLDLGTISSELRNELNATLQASGNATTTSLASPAAAKDSITQAKWFMSDIRNLISLQELSSFQHGLENYEQQFTATSELIGGSSNQNFDLLLKSVASMTEASNHYLSSAGGTAEPEAYVSKQRMIVQIYPDMENQRLELMLMQHIYDAHIKLSARLMLPENHNVQPNNAITAHFSLTGEIITNTSHFSITNGNVAVGLTGTDLSHWSAPLAKTQYLEPAHQEVEISSIDWNLSTEIKQTSAAHTATEQLFIGQLALTLADGHYNWQHKCDPLNASSGCYRSSDNYFITTFDSLLFSLQGDITNTHSSVHNILLTLNADISHFNASRSFDSQFNEVINMYRYWQELIDIDPTSDTKAKTTAGVPDPTPQPSITNTYDQPVPFDMAFYFRAEEAAISNHITVEFMNERNGLNSGTARIRLSWDNKRLELYTDNTNKTLSIKNQDGLTLTLRQINQSGVYGDIRFATQQVATIDQYLIHYSDGSFESIL